MIDEPPRQTRIRLDEVTLCAVSSSNLKATVRALQVSLAQLDFAKAVLLTDRDPASLDLGTDSEIQVTRIEPLQSSKAYSDFLLSSLPDYISTSHCLIVQWDGHVLDAGRWKDEFLEYDYVGASWPQFDDGHDVGNGGFSLRSRRLMEACRHPEFWAHHPEDVAIGRTNRALLESLDLRFAPAELADQFSAERAGDPSAAFGYHGVFLMPQVIGTDEFWELYLTLDEQGSVQENWQSILMSIRRGRKWISRSLIFLRRCLQDSLAAK